MHTPQPTGRPNDFQQLIQRLQNYWAERSCLVLQPYDHMMGAGTFHPATFLRALGPEPWRAAYVQGVRRPSDGRYGDNPNRLQHYYQFQVLLKPAPEDCQQAYLDSLKALGLELGRHDLRFVEDDWESPTLGAWGLGWEVQLDGMEITQFTYFQQVGGLDCRPVSCEITYGLERLAMYLQEVDSVFDLTWAHTPDGGALCYKDLYRQAEAEMSAANFEHADGPGLRAALEQCESDCTRLLEAELPLPAYDSVLRASHVFNLLDAGGLLSVTERQRGILRVRRLARDVAAAWLHARERLNFPLLSGWGAT